MYFFRCCFEEKERKTERKNHCTVSRLMLKEIQFTHQHLLRTTEQITQLTATFNSLHTMTEISSSCNVMQTSARADVKRFSSSRNPIEVTTITGVRFDCLANFTALNLQIAIDTSSKSNVNA